MKEQPRCQQTHYAPRDEEHRKNREYPLVNEGAREVDAAQPLFYKKRPRVFPQPLRDSLRAYALPLMERSACSTRRLVM